MLANIGTSKGQQKITVLKMSQPNVTSITQKLTHLPGIVVIIQNQMDAPAADCTLTSL